VPNSELTYERITEEVRTSLGGSGVEVELTDGDIKVCVRKALRPYNRYLPFQGRHAITVAQATKRIRLDNVIPNLLGVVDVEWITRRTEPAGVDPFDPYVTSLTGPTYGDETFGDVAQRLSYSEDASRIVSSEPEWHAQWEQVDVGGSTYENHYFVYVSVESDNVEAAVTFNARYTEEEDAQGLLAVPAGDVDWIIEYAIAYAKTILSRIRGKFAGITNPEGSADLVDYAELAQEGREDMEQMEEDLKLRRRPGVPVIE